MQCFINLLQLIIFLALAAGAVWTPWTPPWLRAWLVQLSGSMAIEIMLKMAKVRVLQSFILIVQLLVQYSISTNQNVQYLCDEWRNPWKRILFSLQELWPPSQYLLFHKWKILHSQKDFFGQERFEFASGFVMFLLTQDKDDKYQGYSSKLHTCACMTYHRFPIIHCNILT